MPFQGFAIWQVGCYLMFRPRGARLSPPRPLYADTFFCPVSRDARRRRRPRLSHIVGENWGGLRRTRATRSVSGYACGRSSRCARTGAWNLGDAYVCARSPADVHHADRAARARPPRVLTVELDPVVPEQVLARAAPIQIGADARAHGVDAARRPRAEVHLDVRREDVVEPRPVAGVEDVRVAFEHLDDREAVVGVRVRHHCREGQPDRNGSFSDAGAGLVSRENAAKSSLMPSQSARTMPTTRGHLPPTMMSPPESRRKPNVLLVDDEHAFRTSTALLLEASGYPCVAASTVFSIISRNIAVLSVRCCSC